MKLTTLLSMAKSGQLQLQLGVQRLLNPVYRAFFISAAASSGVLRKLAQGPVGFETLAEEFAPNQDTRNWLAAWLRVGVALGELSLGPSGYRLRRRLAKQLADPENDALAALLEEAITLDRELLMRTPALLARGQKLKFADQQEYGPLVARSSRVFEPFVFEALDDFIPTRGQFRMLEIGCGAAGYIRYAAARNNLLTAVGLELQPQVAKLARENIRKWRLQERVSIEVGDARERAVEPIFDLVTLHNNIYYFAVESRVEVLFRLKSFLKPNGRVLITTACQDGHPGIEYS